MIYLTLFFEFFKIGLFCFGGAFGMLPVIKDVVLKYQWLSEDQFYNLVGVAESTPGPIAVNMATYIGSTQGGILGSIVATLGVVLPSFIIILLIASVMKSFTKNRYFVAFMKGVKPIVCALIISTGIELTLKGAGFISITKWEESPVSIAVFLVITMIYFAYGKIRKRKLSAIPTILLSAVLGIAFSMILE